MAILTIQRSDILVYESFCDSLIRLISLNTNICPKKRLTIHVNFILTVYRLLVLPPM